MKLDLTKHCIETEIKRLYNRSISLYLKLKKEDPRFEADILLLQTALECLDFPRLRSRHAELAGRQGNPVVELTAGDDGKVVVRIDGRDAT
jgi:hypothetical protein